MQWKHTKIRSVAIITCALLIVGFCYLFIYNPKQLAASIRNNDVVKAASLIKHYPYLINLALDHQTKLKPLDLAVGLGRYEISSNLIASGADVNSRNVGGETPIYHVYGNFNLDIFDMLIAHGASVSNLNMYANTPLYCAVINENAEAVRVLIVHGANPMGTNAFGKTCLNYAVESSNLDIVELLTRSNSLR